MQKFTALKIVLLHIRGTSSYQCSSMHQVVSTKYENKPLVGWLFDTGLIISGHWWPLIVTLQLRPWYVSKRSMLS